MAVIGLRFDKENVAKIMALPPSALEQKLEGLKKPGIAAARK